MQFIILSVTSIISCSLKRQFLEYLGIGNKAPDTAVDTVNFTIRPADQKCGLRHAIELLL